MFSARKILSGLVLLAVGLGVTIAKGDVPANLLSLMQWLYSAFVIGNIGEHVTTAYKATNSTDKSAK